MQKVTSPRRLLSPKKSTCPLRQADPPDPEARDRQQRAYLDACVDLHRLLGVRLGWKISGHYRRGGAAHSCVDGNEAWRRREDVCAIRTNGVDKWPVTNST